MIGYSAPKGDCRGKALFIMGRHVRFRGRGPTSLGTSLLVLVGHLVGTCLIFLVFLSLTWVIAYSVSLLDDQHKFPPNVMNVITQVELWLLYVDIALCSIVLLLGTIRFCIDLVERRYE